MLPLGKFNELCNDLFDKAMVYVDRALNRAKLSLDQLDYVVEVLIWLNSDNK